eukprot:m51a1_g13884 hypothetical protein (226) ;mRNA; r:658301-659106
MAGLVGMLVDVGMVFLPTVGFVPQYLDMTRRRSSEGFSPLVPAILLAANSLRLCFWFTSDFSAVLAWQSVVMIAAQLVVLEACVRLRQKPATGAFWDWPTFTPYVSVFAFFCLGSGLVTLLFAMISHWLVELVGFVAVAVEASLAVPQYLKNRDTRSTEGFSPLLLAAWFAGDAFKTAYFVLRRSPLQFVLCGTFQLLLDVLITLQFATYPRPGSASLTLEPLPH